MKLFDDITNVFSKKQQSPNKEVDMASIFSRPRTADEQTPELAKVPAVTLGEDVDFKGSLSFKDKLYINGRFEGDINSEGGLLVVGRSAEIKAEIKVGNIISEGRIFGNTVVADKVDLRSPCQVFGDIQAARFSVEEGVVFVGNANINPGEVEPKTNEPVQSSKSAYTQETDILENQIKF